MVSGQRAEQLIGKTYLGVAQFSLQTALDHLMVAQAAKEQADRQSESARMYEGSEGGSEH